MLLIEIVNVTHGIVSHTGFPSHRAKRSQMVRMWRCHKRSNQSWGKSKSRLKNFPKKIILKNLRELVYLWISCFLAIAHPLAFLRLSCASSFPGLTHLMAVYLVSLFPTPCWSDRTTSTPFHFLNVPLFLSWSLYSYPFLFLLFLVPLSFLLYSLLLSLHFSSYKRSSLLCMSCLTQLRRSLLLTAL